ncbi:ion transporter [Halovulum sp. GXIMD14794]
MALRARIYDVLEGNDPRFGRPYLFFNNAVIVLAVVAYAASTMPDLSENTRLVLYAIETVVIFTFALDYMLRLISAPSALGYVFSFWGIVDLIAWAPALLLGGTDLSSTRIIRLIQLARVLKLLRLAKAFDILLGALKDVREQLIVFVIFTLIMLFLASVGIYQFEHPAQPELFKSVPHSMWWAVATLSTVGYGDIYPVTAGGRIFTGIVLLVGLSVIAVPTGLISAALVQKTREESNKENEHEET